MPLFNAQTAAEFGRRGQAARKAAEAKRKAVAALPPQPAAPLSERNSATDLARARGYDALIQKLKAQLAGEKDPARADRLASAIARLEPIYQTYMNIPQPGRRKLAVERKGWRGPLDYQPSAVPRATEPVAEPINGAAADTCPVPTPPYP